MHAQSAARFASHAVAMGLTLLIGLSPQTVFADATDSPTHDSLQKVVARNALLRIDQNRTKVVDRIVAQWGDTLAGDVAGLDQDDLRAVLNGLRSDHLLAASLARNVDGLS